MNQISIGGVTYNFPNGSNVSIVNGKIKVDGKVLEQYDNRPIYVEIHGNVNNLRSDNTVTVHGNVLGSVDAGNSVECGNIGGDVDAGNSVYAKEIKGKVKAGNSIHYK